MNIIIQLVIAFLALGLTYVVTSEGLWGAALVFFNVLFSAMIAFNYYEPLARLIDSTGINWGFSDTLCMLGLFCISLVLFRIITETVAPVMVRFPMPVYHVGRLIFGLGASAVTMAVVLLSFHAAPVHKKIFFSIDHKTKPPFGLGLDHLWLSFYQYETGAVFSNLGYGKRDPYRTYGHGGAVNLFDPKAEWLLLHDDARPYGEGSVLGDEGGALKAEPPLAEPRSNNNNRVDSARGNTAPP